MLDATLGEGMGRRLAVWMATILMLGAASSAVPQQGGDRQAAQDPQDAMTRKLLARLDLEKYKATIKGLAQFGDRRQGRSVTASPRPAERSAWVALKDF